MGESKVIRKFLTARGGVGGWGGKGEWSVHLNSHVVQRSTVYKMSRIGKYMEIESRLEVA